MSETRRTIVSGRVGPGRVLGVRGWRVFWILLCWGVATLVGLVLGAGAGAATGHEFVAGLSEAPVGTDMVGPEALAVDQSSGLVFVGDPGSGYVDVFSLASGKYVARFGAGLVDPAGVAVDEASGDVYVADAVREAVLVFGPDGDGGYGFVGQWFGYASPGRAFGRLAGVAVDNSNRLSAGEVYVVESRSPDLATGTVDVFRPRATAGEEGEFIRRLSGGKLEEPNGVAVSRSTGQVLVADSLKGAVLAYSASGAFEGKITGKGSPYGPFKGKEEALGNVAAVTVDEAGNIFVAEAERHAVSQYSAAGAWEGWITETPGGGLGEPRGVALSSEGDLFIADAGLAVVDRFGPGVVVPDVETGKVAKATLTRTTAVLAGTINGNGIAAQYSFQYGETPALGSQTQSKSSGTGLASVSSEVTGLHAGGTYYYRIVGSNEDGTNVGVVRSFETPPAVEGLATGPVTELQPEQATLTGTLNPGGVDTHYYFQWGATNAYGNTTPAPPGTDAGSATSTLEAQTLITGLAANTVYHYRLVGENEQYGATYGQDLTFTTSGPPRITYEPPSEISQTGAAIHAQINPDQLDTTYRFQYGESTAYGTEVPVGGEAIGSGSAPVSRSVTLTGLRVGATYHYRVVAENEAGSTGGPDQTFSTVASAPVDATYASGVSATEATLHALINPLGNDTRYYFQYGTQSCQLNPGACTNTPLPPGEDVGASGTDVAASAQVSGLQPGTTYHYRVVASNGLGETEGPEHEFTTQQQAGSFALPDGRAWEMVTPRNKGAAPVEALTREGGIILASTNGNGLTYVVNGALGEGVQGNRSPEMQQIIASRSAEGWRSQDIATPSAKAKGVAGGNAPEYQFFAPDLSLALDEPAEPGAQPPLAPGVTQGTPYIRDNASGMYVPLVTEADTQPGVHFNEHIHFGSASADLSHVVIASSVALTGAGSSHGLYEWSGGRLEYVSVLPNGALPSSELELGFSGRVVAGAVSNSGSHVVWTVKTENSGRGRLYMSDTTRKQTVRLDAAKGVAEPVESSAQFQAASSDGSRIFFTDRQRLTPDSTTEPGQAQTAGKPDLYVCEVVEVDGKLTCSLKDLTVDPVPGEHAAVQNLIFGTSEGGTSVYLVAQGVLAGNENGNGETAQSGRDNLYHLHCEGSRWSTTFVAMLSEEDRPEWEGGTIKADTAFLTARVSPNGRYLAFMSAAPITGYDNIDSNPAAKGARDEEVFLYDSATASLRCVSCNPSGARPAGVLDTAESGEGLGLLVDRRKVWAEQGQEHWLAGNIPGWTAQSLTSALFQSRYLSDQGRLYFNSPDSLVPAATNGKEDVYEYEPSGVGSCRSPSGGCVSLLSGGSSDRESAFLEATPEGSNVFFVTEAQLLPQDTDTAFDIYDARECSEASPCLTPPEAPAPPCEEAITCRPAPPAQQAPGGPAGTATFSGAGNITTGPAPGKQETRAKQESKKPLTRAEKLKRALKRCRRQHAHSMRKRKLCERHVRKRYGKKARPKAQGRAKRSSARRAGR